MRIERAPAKVALVDAGDVVAANWAETGFDIPFAPSVELYETAEAQNSWFALAAFDEDKLIGYSSAWVYRHPFNPAVIFASSEALYVKPAYRHGTTTHRLIRATEAESKKLGASRFLWHTRAGTPFAEMLMRRGYKDLDVIVMKEI
jgi:hypothetical protein